MFKRVVVVLFLAISFYSGPAQTNTTLIVGKNSDYANSVIEVYSFDDFITRKLVLIASDSINNKGEFRIKVPLSETKYIQIPLGYYKGVIYIEPNTEYEIVLPEKREKTFADLLNPYFKPVDIYLGVRNSDAYELNYMIREFESIYDRYVDENYYQIFNKPVKDSVDKVISNIENLFDTIPNAYFKNFRTYKYSQLRYASYMRNNLYITNDYYNNMPLLYQNVAYMDLFNQLYSNYLSFYMNTSEGERIYSDIALAKSPYLVKETMSNNLVLLNDSIQELVLLKGLFDAFYLRDFPHASMLITLDSIANFSEINEHKKIANNIREKVLLAKSGYPAPEFELYDSQGAIRKKSDFEVSYVYLNFCSVQNFACQQDFKLLKELHEKYEKDFKIISISIDEDFQMAKNFFESNDYEWTLLSYKNDQKVLGNYNVRVFPTYYLIGPKGDLKMSPAVSPGENFESRFFNHIREVKLRDLRNNRE